jgi:hypothetical protein
MKSTNKKASKSLSNGKVISRKNVDSSEDQEFENYLQKIEDPDYDGQDVS